MNSHNTDILMMADEKHANRFETKSNIPSFGAEDAGSLEAEEQRVTELLASLRAEFGAVAEKDVASGSSENYNHEGSVAPRIKLVHPELTPAPHELKFEGLIERAIPAVSYVWYFLLGIFTFYVDFMQGFGYGIAYITGMVFSPLLGWLLLPLACIWHVVFALLRSVLMPGTIARLLELPVERQKVTYGAQVFSALVLYLATLHQSCDRIVSWIVGLWLEPERIRRPDFANWMFVGAGKAPNMMPNMVFLMDKLPTIENEPKVRLRRVWAVGNGLYSLFRPRREEASVENSPDGEGSDYDMPGLEPNTPPGSPLLRPAVRETWGKATNEGASDAYASVQDFITHLRSIVPESPEAMVNRDFIVSICLAFVSIGAQPTLPTLVSQVAWLVRTHHDLITFDVSTMVQNIVTKFEFHNQGVIEDELEGNTQVMIAAYRVLGLCSVTGLLASLGVVDKTVASDWYSRLRFLASDGKADSLATEFVVFMKELVRTMIAAIRSGDPAVFWRPKMSFMTWRLLSYTALSDIRVRLNNMNPAAFEKIKHELPSQMQEQMTEERRMDWCVYLDFKGMDFEKAEVAKIEAIPYGTVSALRKMLITESISISNEMTNGNSRPQPLGIYIHGPAGVGKSVLVNAIHNTYNAVTGLPTGPRSMYGVEVSANFFDGLHPDHTTVVWDDQDQLRGTLAYGTPNMYTQVIAMVNNKSTQLEQADVAKKGTMFARFRLAVAVSNIDGKDEVPKFVNDPEAFWRRMKYKLYLTRNTTVPITVGMSPEEEDKAWIFTFSVHSKGDTFSAPLIFKSKKQFLRHWVSVARRWNSEQEKLSSILGETHPVHCSKCCLEERLCECVPVVTPPVLEKAGVACPLFAPDAIPSAEDGSPIMEADIVGEAGPEPVLDETLLREKLASNLAFGMCCALLAQFVASIYHCAWGFVFIQCAFLYVCVRFLDLLEAPAATKFTFALLYSYPLLGSVLLYARERATSKEFPLTPEERVARWKAWIMCKHKAVLSLLRKVLLFFAAMVAGAMAISFFRNTSRKNPEGAIVEVSIPPKPAPSGWTVFPTRVNVPLGRVPTETMSVEQMVNLCRHSLVLMKVEKKGKCNAISYQHPYYLAPKHMFTSAAHGSGRIVEMIPRAEFVVTFSARSTPVTVTLVEGTSVMSVPGLDLVVMYVPHIFPLAEQSVRSIVLPSVRYTESVASFERTAFVRPTWQDNGDVLFLATERVAVELDSYTSIKGQPSDHLMIKHLYSTQSGDCCTPLIASYGSYKNLVGLHIMKMESIGSVCGIAEIVSQELIDPIVAALAHVTGVSPMTVRHEALFLRDQLADVNADVFVGPLEPCSHVSSFLTGKDDQKFVVGGTLRPLRPGMTMKSGITPSAMHEEAVAWAKKEGIEITFGPPDEAFRGEMRDGRWLSAFTANMAKMHNGGSNWAIWRTAIAQYSRGFAECKSHFEKLRPLTVEEALFGTAKIRKVDLSTSTGPPHDRPKSRMMSNDPPAIDPILLAEMEYIENGVRDALSKGERIVFSVVAKHTMKAEVMSFTKIQDKEARVFNVCPFMYNLLLKRYAGPIHNAMQENWQVFNMAIGMDIVKAAGDVVDYLREQSPELDKIFAGDYKGQDVKTSTDGMVASVQVTENGSLYTAYSPEECAILSCLLWGLVYTIRIVGKEIVYMSYSNPSGQQCTAHFNSINNVLCFIYALICGCISRGADIPYYREVLALLVLGDDNLGSRSEKIAWFDMLELRHWLSTVGHVYTAADKGKELTPFVTLAEATFLKRSFVFRDNIWWCSLELKSIAKAAMFQHKSKVLGRSDVASAIMDSMQREMFLHGREAFDSFRSHFSAARARFGTGYWRDHTYDELMTSFKEGTFDVWTPKRMHPELDCDDWICTLEGDIAPDVPVASSSVPSVVMPASVATHASDETSTREIRLQRIQLSTADVADTLVTTTSDLFTLILANPVLASRIQYYGGYRVRSLKIRVLVEASATAQGIYQVSPICQSSINTYVDCVPALTVSQLVSAPQTKQISLCQPTMVEFELPWVHPGEYNTLPTHTFGLDTYATCGWTIAVGCLAPLVQSLSVASAETASLTIFATLEGLELFAPFNEMMSEKPSRSVGMAASITRGIGQLVPSISAFTLPVSQGLAAISSVMGALGYTRELRPLEPTPMKIQGQSNTAVVDGVDGSMICGFRNAATVSSDPGIGGGSREDESSFASLFRYWGLVANTTWTQASTAGTVLLSIPVTPVLGYQVGSGPYVLSPGGYVGLPFNFYHGSMEVLVTVGCSNMHHGALQLWWSPGKKTVGSVAVIDPTNATYNCIVDVNAEGAKQITIGWQLPVSAARVRGGVLASTFSPGEINGWFNVSTQSPLRSMGGGSVRVVVHFRPAQDMTFWGGRAYSNVQPASTFMINDLKLEGGETGLGTSAEQCLIAGSSIPANIRETFAGDILYSAKACVQKQSQLAPLKVTVGADGGSFESPLPFYGVPACKGGGLWDVNSYVPDTINTTSATWTATAAHPFSFLAYYKALFVGIRGGVYLKVSGIPVDNGNGGNPFYRISAFGYEGGAKRIVVATRAAPLAPTELAPGQTFTAATLYSVDAEHGAEFYIPFNSMFKFWPAHSGAASPDYTNQKWISLGAGLRVNTVLTLSMSGGPDISLVRYRLVPAIKAPAGGLLFAPEMGAAEAGGGPPEPDVEEDFVVENPQLSDDMSLL